MRYFRYLSTVKLKHDMPMSFTEKLGAAVHDVRRPDWGNGRITRTDAGGAYPITVVFERCVNYYTPDGRDNQYADKVVLVEVFEPAVSDNTPQISPDIAAVRPFLVGDKVVDAKYPERGEGRVLRVDYLTDFPVLAEVGGERKTYTRDGRYLTSDTRPRLKHVNP